MKDTIKKIKNRKVKATIKVIDGRFFLEEEEATELLPMEKVFEPFEDEFVEITINNKEETEGFEEEE